jgi:PRC-barrel domain
MNKAAIVSVAALLLGGAPPAVTSQTITAHLDASVIGHPIYTADGMKIGRVTSIGNYHGKPTMIGEVARLMGFGVRRVLIPDQMATVQGDRVVLSVASDRVEEVLSADQ